jgi:hypothetical protein
MFVPHGDRSDLDRRRSHSCGLRPPPDLPDMQPDRTTRAFLRRFYAAIEHYDALDGFD